MAADDSKMQDTVAEALLGWKAFLESVPPETEVTVATALTPQYPVGGGGASYLTEKTSIELYCDSPECESTVWFDHTSGQASAKLNTADAQILHYRCRLCRRKPKMFAVYFMPLSAQTAAVVKIGEYPPFGPPTPSRVITLIGPNKDLFLKGRRAENHGLGIGAFAYYRRVVEDQKNRIINEIIKVAKKVGAKTEVIEGLTAALEETQFSTAVNSIKPALPESLLIDGHNPLKLLHSALSNGMHEQDDGKCLELAQSIRVVLAELAERIEAALKEEAELKSAVSRILQSKPKK